MYARRRTWQGPSLLCYNDAVFSHSDFRNICSIGSNQKLANSAAIGRFGLGFNAVYHFTDVRRIAHRSFCDLCGDTMRLAF